ncbi:hypothetical protein Hanom_Chr09g00778081 [Helianthus anomalus]
MYIIHGINVISYYHYYYYHYVQIDIPFSALAHGFMTAYHNVTYGLGNFRRPCAMNEDEKSNHIHKTEETSLNVFLVS